MERRIANNVVVVAPHVGRQIEHIDRHEHDALAHRIRRRVPIRQSDQVALDVGSRDTRARHARRQAQARGARATAQFEHFVARRGRHRRRQHHGVQPSAKSVAELAHDKSTAKEAVLADLLGRRASRQTLAQECPAALEILVGDHEAARQNAQTAVHHARVLVEYHALHIALREQVLREAEKHRIVGLEDGPHLSFFAWVLREWVGLTGVGSPSNVANAGCLRQGPRPCSSRTCASRGPTASRLSSACTRWWPRTWRRPTA